MNQINLSKGNNKQITHMIRLDYNALENYFIHLQAECNAISSQLKELSELFLSLNASMPQMRAAFIFRPKDIYYDINSNVRRSYYLALGLSTESNMMKSILHHTKSISSLKMPEMQSMRGRTQLFQFVHSSKYLITQFYVLYD